MRTNHRVQFEGAHWLLGRIFYYLLASFCEWITSPYAKDRPVKEVCRLVVLVSFGIALLPTALNDLLDFLG